MHKILILILLITTSAAHAQPYITTEDDGLKGKVKQVRTSSITKYPESGTTYYAEVTDEYDEKGLKTYNKRDEIGLHGKDTMFVHTAEENYREGRLYTYSSTEGDMDRPEQTVGTVHRGKNGMLSKDGSCTIIEGKKTFKATVYSYDRNDSLLKTEDLEGEDKQNMKIVLIRNVSYDPAKKAKQTDVFEVGENESTPTFSIRLVITDSADHQVYAFYKENNELVSHAIYKVMEDGRSHEVTRNTGTEVQNYQHSFTDMDKQGNYLSATHTCEDHSETVTHKITYYP